MGIKYINIKDLFDNGFLFEINRKILHPHGMALEILIDEEGNKCVLGNVWDYRDDPEGIMFEEATFKQGKKKFENYMRQVGSEKLKARKELLGYVVQSGEEED